MGNTEEQGVLFIRSLAVYSDLIRAEIPTNDRTQSWDGNISVYSDKSCSKKYLEGVLPVQVKSTKVKNFTKHERGYMIEVSDIQNYAKVGGTLLLLVECMEREHRLFVNPLLPSEIKKLNKNIRKNQIKVNVKLKEIGYKDAKDLENICRNFLLHRKKQFSTIDYELSIQDCEKFSISFIPNGDPIDYLLTNENLLYGNRLNDKAEYYLKNIKCSIVDFPKNQPVFINQSRFYSNYRVKKSLLCTELLFGPSIMYNLTTGQISYSLKGKLSEQINDCNVLLEFIKTKQINIGEDGESKITVTEIGNVDTFRNEIENTCDRLKDIKSLLELFHIDPDKLDITEKSLNQFDVESKKNLELLVNVCIYSNQIISVEGTHGIFLLRINNLYFGVLLFKRDSDNNFTLLDLYSPLPNLEFSATILDGRKIPISPYSLLSHDHLAKADNFNFDIVFQSMKLYGLDLDHATLGNLFGLELIKVYDFEKKEIFLKYAALVFDWLEENEELRDISRLNSLQIIRRNKEITTEAKNELISMRSRYSENPKMLCGINILLENKTDAVLNFNELSEDSKLEFTGFPIFTLAKELKIFPSE